MFLIVQRQTIIGNTIHLQKLKANTQTPYVTTQHWTTKQKKQLFGESEREMLQKIY